MLQQIRQKLLYFQKDLISVVTKILDVTYGEDGFAHLRALHIPKHIWNKPYSSIEAKTK